MDGQSLKLAEQVIREATARDMTVATAESCTGGLVSAALTSVSGSSAVFTHGFITYANEAKIGVLGVPESVIASQGAVSQPVAAAMAEGALARATASVSVSLTGIAGPGGGTTTKPVGLVWFGASSAFGTKTERRVFPGRDRHGVRELSVHQALRMLIAEIKQHPG
ncbi:MAG: CinA family protein [Pseudomonadota bacterium]